MQKFIMGRVLTAVVLAALSVPGFAASEDPPNAFSMAGDVVVARPIGAVITVVGAALFVVSLPFTALGGNVKQAGDALVVAPAKETFVRCLGCVTSGRAAATYDVSQ